MQMKAYQNGEHAILARPMTNIDYHMQQDQCEYEDLEGMEVKSGYFIIFDESNFAWFSKAIFERDCKELTLKPTVYRLDYFDGEYRWDLVHSYDRAELEKLIADATEYHKTIKDLDFDDDEAVDAWLENHPLNDFNGDQINDLLDIDDYEPLSEYLSINFFNVSGVSE